MTIFSYKIVTCNNWSTSIASCNNRTILNIIYFLFSIGIKFYRFPSDEKKRALWVAAVNRENRDGTPWKPTASARLCSTHFVGGVRNNDEDHPAYVPTIFPTSNKRPPGENELKRYERAKRRRALKEEALEKQLQSQDDDMDFKNESGFPMVWVLDW